MTAQRIHIPLALLALGALAVACGDSQYIIVERDGEKRRTGDACVLSDDCDSGRCVGGICSDGVCESDDQCLPGELCVFGVCEPADDFACQTDQAPLMQLSTLDVEFGEVALGNTGETTLTIENRGDCLLTISGVGLASDGDNGFGCAPCDPSEFPQRIPPPARPRREPQLHAAGPGRGLQRAHHQLR
jgi:hypothetical protein